jgi:hypothetical protein
MHRTNIYLTERQQAALDARAAAAGSNRSAVLRAIVDADLGLGPTDPSVDAELADAASSIAARARALAAEDPDLSSE